jgi:hypothetical protein
MPSHAFTNLTEAAISDYLRSELSINNACFIYATAALYQLVVSIPD